MALAQKLQLKQTQQLVMTPQLQQAIKLLQFSNLELSEYLAGEIEQNPLLRMPEADPDQAAADDGGAGREETDPGENDPASSDALLRAPGDASAGGDAPLDVDLEQNVYNGDCGYDMAGAAPDGSPSGDFGRLEAAVGPPQSLRSHIEDQIKMMPLAANERIIAAYLVDLIDDRGYIGAGLEEAHARLGCTPAELERVRRLLQGLEPTGIFARDLKECLALQLKERDRLDPCMEGLLDHLDLVAKRDYAALRKICRVDKEDLEDMIHEVHELNPKPGLQHSGGEPIQPVVPDVYVRRIPGGKWRVELNSETLPRVLVNNQYYSELSRNLRSDEDKSYLSGCLSKANWLVKALDQRARTILKVAQEIARRQQGFFDHGVRRLKPLTLRAIADAISMHESTVSRVTANKYIGTSRGIFEMKFFFTSSIASSRGDAHSAAAVKDRIRELIDNEDPAAILSDGRLAEILASDGVDIARRTVAKYREAMRIPSSVQRRREKN